MITNVSSSNPAERVDHLLSGSTRLGATLVDDDRCRFKVWAPRADKVEVLIVEPERAALVLQPGPQGYFEGETAGLGPGALYFYRLDDDVDVPDPASRLQPRGVHGPSAVVAHDHRWRDDGWTGLPLHGQVFYELHVGTFTPQGTFGAVIPHLDELADLGIKTVQLMPVAQFPGERNWGYDCVFPFAVQNSYGGPDGLCRLVDAAHERGLAVALDVVFNHLGPEGNVLAHFGPYFTDRYRTPWGDALNFDGPYSDEVRRFFIESAVQWVVDYHVDVLRVDAIHGIVDRTPRTFLQDLTAAVHRAAASVGRRVLVIAESDLNDAAVVRPAARGGMGFDAQWSDDFHHAVHALLTGERRHYYCDFGSIDELVKAYTEGFVYDGRYSAFRMRCHGTSSRSASGCRHVVFAQNHDQVGNRPAGDRLSEHLSFAELRLAAALVVFSPFLPLLFMGEEYGETSPFPYFIDHSGEELIEAVRRGRERDFAGFAWDGGLPDPADPETFRRAKLDHGLRRSGPHRRLHDYYRELLRLRRTIPALARPSKRGLAIDRPAGARALAVCRRSSESHALVGFCFDAHGQTMAAPAGRWHRRLDSAERRWGGEGSDAPEILAAGESTLVISGLSAVLYERETPAP